MRLGSLFCRALAFVAGITLSVDQESWEDGLKRYLGAVDLSAPEGYRTVAAPSAGPLRSRRSPDR